MSKVKFGKNRFEEGDDLQCDVEIIDYTLSDDEYNDAIGKIVLDNNALKLIFLKDMTEKQLKIAAGHFIAEEFLGVDVSDDEMHSKIEELINGNKGYYSFFAEALSVPVLAELFSYEPIRATVAYGTSSTITSQGADSVLYDEDTKTIVMVESKFYADFSSGISSVGNSIVEYGKKVVDLLTAIRACEKEIIVYCKKINGNSPEVSDSGMITLGEIKKVKKIIIGFVLHEEKSKYKSKINKFNRNDGYLKDSEFGIVDKVILIHLPIKNKMEFILDIQKMARELHDEK